MIERQTVNDLKSINNKPYWYLYLNKLSSVNLRITVPYILCLYCTIWQKHTKPQTRHLLKHTVVFEFGCEKLAFMKGPTLLIKSLFRTVSWFPKCWRHQTGTAITFFWRMLSWGYCRQWHWSLVFQRRIQRRLKFQWEFNHWWKNFGCGRCEFGRFKLPLLSASMS